METPQSSIITKNQSSLPDPATPKPITCDHHFPTDCAYKYASDSTMSRGDGKELHFLTSLQDDDNTDQSYHARNITIINLSEPPITPTHDPPDILYHHGDSHTCDEPDPAVTAVDVSANLPLSSAANSEERRKGLVVLSLVRDNCVEARDDARNVKNGAFEEFRCASEKLDQVRMTQESAMVSREQILLASRFTNLRRTYWQSDTEWYLRFSKDQDKHLRWLSTWKSGLEKISQKDPSPLRKVDRSLFGDHVNAVGPHQRHLERVTRLMQGMVDRYDAERTRLSGEKASIISSEEGWRRHMEYFETLFEELKEKERQCRENMKTASLSERQFKEEEEEWEDLRKSLDSLEIQVQ